jgi:hypothetical protein
MKGKQPMKPPARPPEEQKVTYSVRTTKSVQERLKYYAYIERLSIGDALEQLLNRAGAQ